MSLLVYYRFTGPVQRISNCGEIRNIIHTPDKVRNVLIYGSLRFDEIQYVGEHVK